MSDYLSKLFSLAGRVAVVTGGSSGIGKDMASALARAETQVVLVARDAARLEESAAGLCAEGCTVGWISADLGIVRLSTRPLLRWPQYLANPTFWLTARGSTSAHHWPN